MSRKISKKHLLAGLATAGVLGVGIAAPTIALADNGGTPTPNATASSKTDGHGDRQAKFAEALAKELGIPTEKVTAALQALRDQHRPGEQGKKPEAGDRAAMLRERLAQAVKDGKLTQEQADAITKAVEAGVLPGNDRRGHDGRTDWRGRDWQGGQQRGSDDRPGGWRGHEGGLRGMSNDFAAALAKQLGVPTEKVTAALEKLRAQHEKHGLGRRPEGRQNGADERGRPDRTEGTKDRTAWLKDRLDKAVADGKLTRAEADAITKAFTDNAFGGFHR